LKIWYKKSQPDCENFDNTMIYLHEWKIVFVHVDHVYYVYYQTGDESQTDLQVDHVYYACYLAGDGHQTDVNNDNSFRLLIGVINTAMYHKDGVHLDWHGTLQQAET
jgi:hypothetical protein